MTECCSIRIKQLRECLERSLKPTTGTIVENAGDAGFTTTNKNKNNTIVHHHHQNQHQQHSSTNNRTLQILFKTCEAVVIKISSTSSSSQSSSSSSILNSAVTADLLAPPLLPTLLSSQKMTRGGSKNIDLTACQTPTAVSNNPPPPTSRFTVLPVTTVNPVPLVTTMTAFPAEFGRQEEEGENDEEAEDGIANKSRPLRVIVKPLIDTTSRGTLASAAPDGNMMMERLLAVDCSRSKKEAASLDSSSAAAAANGGGGGGQGGSIVVVASSPSGSIDSGVASPGADSYLGGSPPITTTINNPLNIISNEKTGPIGALLRTTSPLNTIPRAASSSLRFTFPTDVQNNSSLLIDALALQQSIYDAKNKGVSIIPQQQNQTTVWPQQNEFGTWPPGRPTSQKPITFADSEKTLQQPSAHIPPPTTPGDPLNLQQQQKNNIIGNGGTLLMGQRRSVPVFASLMALPAKPPPFNNEVRRQLSVEYADSSSHKNIKGILKKPKTKSLENPEIVGGSVLNHTTNGCFILGRNHVRRPPTRFVLSRSVSESLLEMENFDDPMLSPTGNNYRGGNCAVCSSPEYLASFCHCTSSIAAGKRMIPFDELQELEEDGSTRQRLGTGTFLNAELLDDCISLDDADLPDCHGGSIRKAAMAAVAKFAPRPLSDDSGNESAKSTSSRETIDDVDDEIQPIQENPPKKRVSFSEHVQARIYRSNSSILGQKKKNEKKARQKAGSVCNRSRTVSSDSQQQNYDSGYMNEHDGRKA